MIKNKIMKCQVVVCIISIILGILLHFLYQLSNENIIIASFSAVNESVWEHLKLIFFPMLLMSIIEYPVIKKIANNYIEAKTIGIFVAIIFTVTFFYTYSGILGTNFLILDILTFVFSIIIGEYVAYILMIRNIESNTLSKTLSIIIIIFFLISFIAFTYNPPKVNLFKDTTDGTYGIK